MTTESDKIKEQLKERLKEEQLSKGHADPTHRMASPKVRYIFYLGVLALSVMIYFLVQVRYLTEEAPKKQQQGLQTPPQK